MKTLVAANKSNLALVFSLTILLSLSTGKIYGQKIVKVESPNLAVEAQIDASGKGTIIFSNLGPTPADAYDSGSFAKFPLAGKSVIGVPETWAAINFIPKKDVQAHLLRAAINHVSGTSLVRLGLYSDAAGKVGSPLPGGQGTTTDIPPSGECCALTEVTLVGSGVTLTAGTRYWLVASPDNVNAPDFNGSWQVSNEGSSAQGGPPSGQFTTGSGAWPAAEVRSAAAAGSTQPAERAVGTRPGRITIFSNLDKRATDSFNPTLGYYVSGKDADIGAESWLAVPFTPKVSSHATTLAAAIGYVSGDMKVNLGIYSDSDGTVGTVLPNGQASTSAIPAYPDCCDLAEVVLPGAGVALTARTRYWLVASTDDINAPRFEGIWREATVYSNYQEPQFFFWTFVESRWFAAEVRGTTP
ncbi:MAG: hypothetical protein ABIR29_11625 [Chthoniobacterales bacterium]